MGRFEIYDSIRAEQAKGLEYPPQPALDSLRGWICFSGLQRAQQLGLFLPFC